MQGLSNRNRLLAGAALGVFCATAFILPSTSAAKTRNCSTPAAALCGEDSVRRNGAPAASLALAVDLAPGDAASKGSGPDPQHSGGVVIVGSDIEVSVDDVVTTEDHTTGVQIWGTDSIDAVVGNVITSGDGSSGVIASGLDTVLHAGNVSTSGQDSTGVYVAGSNSVAATVGDISTTGNSSLGIYAEGNEISLEAGSITTAGDDSSGIFAAGLQITINASDVSTAGYLSDGIAIFAEQSGNVTAGNISTSGDGSYGVYARSLGDLAVSTEDISTSVDLSSGIVAVAMGENSVTAHDISTSGFNSFGILAIGSEAVVTAGDISTSGEAAFGIGAVADGSATVFVGDISTSGAFDEEGGSSFGVLVSATDASLHAGNVSTNANQAFGVFLDALNSAVGSVGNVSTAGDYSVGIGAVAGDIQLTAGNVSTGGLSSNGLDLWAENSIDASVGSVSANGDFSSAIYAWSDQADVKLEAGDIVAHGEMTNAVTVFAHGSIEVSLGDVDVTGFANHGIYLDGADIVLSAGSVSVESDLAFGVVALAANSIEASLGNVWTSGESSYGIEMAANDIKLEAGNVTTEGDYSDAIQMIATNAIDVSVGEVSTVGVLSSGVFLLGTDIGLEAGNVTTGGNDSAAIELWAANDIDLRVGDVRTAGENSFGISALGTNVDLLAGNVATAGGNAVGVQVRGSGAINATIGNVSTAGDYSSGVVIVGADGPVRLDVGAIDTAGIGSWALAVRTNGGSQDITIGGASATGQGAGAIAAISKGDGDVRITANGDVSARDGIGIQVQTLGSSTINLASQAGVTGLTGILSAAAQGSTINIGGTVSATSGPAILADGGSANIMIGSTGTLDGFVDLTDVADLVANNGRWISGGTSDFGLGEDRLVNYGELSTADGSSFAGLEEFRNSAGGTLSLGAGTTLFEDTNLFRNEGKITAFAGETRISSLASLDNVGLIDMVDGSADDVLTIGEDYAGSGNASLAVDFDGNSADMLVIEGEATGRTSVFVSPSPGAVFNSGGVLLVDAAGGTENAFVIGSSGAGLFSFAISQRGEDYYLQSLPGRAALEPVAIGNLAQDLWQQSAGIYTAYASQRRGDLGYSCEGQSFASNELGWWGQIYRGHDERGRTSRSLLFGAELAVDASAETERSGIQLGFDHLLGPNVIIGVTAGFERAEADFSHSQSSFKASGYNLGGYVMTQFAGGFYGDLLVKYDQSELELGHSAFAQAGGDPAIKALGIEGKAGYRFASAANMFDVGIALSKVDARIDGFNAQDIFFDYEKVSSLRAAIGGRVQLGGNSGRPYLDARLHHEFDGDTRLKLTSGALSDSLEADAKATWGRFELGAGGDRSGKPSIAAWADFGDVKGIGLRAGIRF